jgi:hypothetical protein
MKQKKAAVVERTTLTAVLLEGTQDDVFKAFPGPNDTISELIVSIIEFQPEEDGAPQTSCAITRNGFTPDGVEMLRDAIIELRASIVDRESIPTDDAERHHWAANKLRQIRAQMIAVETELENDFPSLAAAAVLDQLVGEYYDVLATYNAATAETK